MCPAYARWNWKPIPTAQGILFRFPSDSGLELLTKRDVIPCRNGQFFVKRWSETNPKDHIFQFKANLLLYNLPPFLRAMEELSKMLAPFAHLIQAVQVMEEGGPMKVRVGCRRKQDIPKEVVVIYGDKEFTIAIAIRDVVEEGGIKKPRARGGGDGGRRSFDGVEKSTEKGKQILQQEKRRFNDAGSSSAPAKKGEEQSSTTNWVFSRLGETAKAKEKEATGVASFGVNEIVDVDGGGRANLGNLNLKEKKEEEEFTKEKREGFSRGDNEKSER